MFLQNTYNYAIGYANIQVEGYFTERFMNLCMNRNIQIWDISRKYDGVITLKINSKDLEKVKDIATTTKSNLTILKSDGIPYILQNMGQRTMQVAELLMPALLSTKCCQP